MNTEILFVNTHLSTFTSLTDNSNIEKLLSQELKKTIIHKISMNKLHNFEISIGDTTYEISINKSTEQQFVILLTPLIQRSFEHSIELETSLREQQTKLFELAKSRKISKATLQETLESLCKTISHLIDCERISIWLFDEDHTKLTAQNIFDKRTDVHTRDEMLVFSEYPLYFNSVKGKRALAIHDVSQDSRVKELYPDYFSSVGGVRSMLDAPIMMSSGIGGVLCCESLKSRIWNELDQILVGTLADMVAFLYERISRLEAEDRVRELAFIDQLTGLNNQHAFYEQTTEQLTTEKEGIFVYLQLDQFAAVQDALGFGYGEEVLKQSADMLKSSFQKPSIVARIGFDHFAIFLSTEDSINLKANLKKLKKPMFIDNQEVYMTYSYGTSKYPENGESAKECLQSAQIALNDGRKYLSRDVHATFTPEMIEIRKSDLQVEMNLRKGLDFEEFVLLYQPQITCVTGKAVGFEALIRWRHPEKGLVSPVEFIPLAESTGLILPIGEWVICQAFKQLQQWKDSGNDEFTISINISPRHFLSEKLVEFLLECLSSHSVSADRLRIEITESVAMEDYAVVKKRIEVLNQLGFVISIDDFGTGFSAFVYLQHFEVHEIKIDRKFIQDIEHNPKSLGIVKSIIDLADSLNIHVICEGIETESQLSLLRKIGCKTVQGFYFAKPLPIEETLYWLQK
ncbi:MAG: GGDEF and EAL domain-containing protein [Paenisporosarcina sp.]|nr:GGDEF and EAL domain-containing protein [Paenisporosarcina sp.]